jgi:hypothetical protein
MVQNLRKIMAHPFFPSNIFLLFFCQQKDLIRRLREVVEALKDPDVEPNSPDFPGLGGLSAVLIEDGFLEHRDKEVRLHTVLGCMQILEVVSHAHSMLSTVVSMHHLLTHISVCTGSSLRRHGGSPHLFAVDSATGQFGSLHFPKSSQLSTLS